MKRRLLSVVIALMMTASIIGITGVQVSAAERAYASFSTACDRDTMPDKVGNYYIWADQTGKTAKLQCASTLTGDSKTIAEAKAGKWIANTAITNGSTVYYGEQDNPGQTKKTTIYKTTMAGKAVKVKTLSGECEPIAYYKGKLYYNKYRYSQKEAYGSTTDLYFYDTSKKSTKLVAKNFRAESSYGKYVTHRKYSRSLAVTEHLYNLAGKGDKKLPKAYGAVVDGKSVYYYTASANKATVKKCSLSGKNIKTVKTIKKKNLGLLYFGRTAAYFMDDKGKTIKLTYKTKTVEQMK